MRGVARGLPALNGSRQATRRSLGILVLGRKQQTGIQAATNGAICSRSEHALGRRNAIESARWPRPMRRARRRHTRTLREVAKLIRFCLRPSEALSELRWEGVGKDYLQIRASKNGQKQDSARPDSASDGRFGRVAQSEQQGR